MNHRTIKSYGRRARTASVGALTNSVGLPSDTTLATGAGAVSGALLGFILFPAGFSMILVGAVAGGLLGYKIGSDREQGK